MLLVSMRSVGKRVGAHRMRSAFERKAGAVLMSHGRHCSASSKMYYTCLNNIIYYLQTTTSHDTHQPPPTHNHMHETRALRLTFRFCSTQPRRRGECDVHGGGGN